MIHTLFFRILAVLAFFCALVFRFFIPIGILGIGLGFGWGLLDIAKSGGFPPVTSLELSTWANTYLQWLPFSSLKGAFLFSVVVSLFEYLSSTNTVLQRHPYLSRVTFAVMLYGLICVPYLVSVSLSTPEQLVPWLGIVLLCSVMMTLVAILETQRLPLIRAIPSYWHQLGKTLWRAKW